MKNGKFSTWMKVFLRFSQYTIFWSSNVNFSKFDFQDHVVLGFRMKKLHFSTMFENWTFWNWRNKYENLGWKICLIVSKFSRNPYFENPNLIRSKWKHNEALLFYRFWKHPFKFYKFFPKIIKNENFSKFLGNTYFE